MRGKDWPMVELLAAMDHSDVLPLTLCYLTVPRDPQSIVPVSYLVARRAHGAAQGAAECAAPLEQSPYLAGVRARTSAVGAVSARRLTGSWSGS